MHEIELSFILILYYKNLKIYVLDQDIYKNKNSTVIGFDSIQVDESKHVAL